MKDLEKRLSIIEEKLGINNDELVVGKWYLYVGHLGQCKPLMCITNISDANAKFIGFDYHGKWTDSDFYPISELDRYGYREATPQEVEEALVKEAKRRYKVGDKVECLVSRMTAIITETPYVSTSSSVNALTDCLASGYIYLFQNGNWAEVIEQQSDKFAELKEAHRNGAVIQCKPKCTMNYSCWADEHNPKWNPKFEYRIKPMQQPTLEQDIQQLKNKYKQYKFTITIEDNI